MAKEYNESYAKDFLFSVPVSVEVSLGAKLAQLRGECWHAHGLDTVTPLHMCFLCHRAVVCMHSITLPTHSRWLKVATKHGCICHCPFLLLSRLCCLCSLSLFSLFSLVLPFVVPSITESLVFSRRVFSISFVVFFSSSLAAS